MSVDRNRTVHSEVMYLLTLAEGGRVEFMLSDRPRSDETICCQFSHPRLATNAVGFGGTTGEAVRAAVDALHLMVAEHKRTRRRKAAR